MPNFNREIKGAIFDIDGTLLDSLSMFLECLNRELERQGISPVSRQFLYERLGKGISLKGFLGNIVDGTENAILVEEMAKNIVELFWEEDFHIPLFPGVKEVFSFLYEKGVKIGLATSRDSGAAYEWDRFRHNGLAKYIQSIFTSREVKNRKPHPEVIIRCGKEMGIELKSCLSIGDTVSDILAGKRAGTYTVGVCSGVDTYERLQMEEPDAIIVRVRDLIHLPVYL